MDRLRSLSTRLSLLHALLPLLLVCSGCAGSGSSCAGSGSSCAGSGYWADRGRDLGDCARGRLALGLGLYAELQLTPLVEPAVGLADATLAPRYSLEWDPSASVSHGELRTAAFPTLLLAWPWYGYVESQDGYADTHPYLRGFVAPWILQGTHHIERSSGSLLLLHELNRSPRLSDPEFEDAQAENEPAQDAASGARSLADWGWLGGSTTLIGVRVDAGFNFLELADFVLGWTGIDFLGDDNRPTPASAPRQQSPSP